MKYDPSVFTDIETLTDAQRIILTPEAGMTTTHRWETETPLLVELVRPHLDPRSTVLDYGCGVGRLSKPILNILGAQYVVGADISANMRALASSLVERDEFAAVHPKMLALLPDKTFDFCVAVWVLQHCVDPHFDVGLIRDKLKVGGRLFVVNNTRRAVPCVGGAWIDDGTNIQDILVRYGFSLLGDVHHFDDPLVAPGWMSENTFWAVYERRA